MISDSVVSDWKNRILLWVDIPDEQWRRFQSLLFPRTLKTGEHLIRAGQRATDFGYVASGILREYYLSPEGAENNKAFCTAGQMTGSYFDLLSEQDSTVNIQALQDSDLLCGSFESFQKLYDSHPCWERLGRLIAEQMFVRKARREYEFLTMTASLRYARLCEEQPSLLANVPQYHIASYLGITPVALSRIRKQKKSPPH
ncbi:MAG: Crp/Fnr family transcriptional regulator [Leptospiraceae bacterium]|nr:Crp/Fnr family transcriptional regulator [Leptospiraceae bacterium]